MTDPMTSPRMCGNPHLVRHEGIHVEQVPHPMVDESRTRLLKKPGVLTGKPISAGVPRRHVRSTRKKTDRKPVAGVIRHSRVMIPVGTHPPAL